MASRTGKSSPSYIRQSKAGQDNRMDIDYEEQHNDTVNTEEGGPSQCTTGRPGYGGSEWIWDEQ
jgi:hypothetical protein